MALGPRSGSTDGLIARCDGLGKQPGRAVIAWQNTTRDDRGEKLVAARRGRWRARASGDRHRSDQPVRACRQLNSQPPVRLPQQSPSALMDAGSGWAGSLHTLVPALRRNTVN